MQNELKLMTFYRVWLANNQILFIKHVLRPFQAVFKHVANDYWKGQRNLNRESIKVKKYFSTKIKISQNQLLPSVKGFMVDYFIMVIRIVGRILITLYLLTNNKPKG